MSNTPTHGSDVQETPDWWKASDGRFYPPELHPNYAKPVDPAPAVAPPAVSDPAASTPSLAERLRAEADRVGDEASAAADAGVGSMGGVGDTLGGATGAAGGAIAGAAAVATGAAAGAAASASDAVAEGMPSIPEAVDPRATILQTPAVTGTPPSPGAPPATPPSMPPLPSAAPVTPPSMPPLPSAAPSMPSPGAPPSMPGAVPPSPGAPPSMPASPSAPAGMPPAPSGSPAMPPAPGAAAQIVEQGPGGITYTAAAEPMAAPGGMPTAIVPPTPGMGFQPPTATAPAKASSPAAGFIALIAGAAAIAGSLLQWGKGNVVGSNGLEKAIIEVPGFDSSGLITAIAGGVLVLVGLLFFMGVPKQLNWAILAFLGGAVIVGAVVFSMIDIGDLSNRYAVQWQGEGLAATGDVITTSADIGLWITGAGGVLGVLAAPFAKRS